MDLITIDKDFEHNLNEHVTNHNTEVIKTISFRVRIEVEMSDSDSRPKTSDSNSDSRSFPNV